MLFKARFHPGIRAGTITETWRTWSTARAKPGGTYRLGASGAIEVTAVDERRLGQITEADARRSGFEGREELIALLRKNAKRRLTSRSRIYRVRFQFVASEDPRKALQGDTSSEAVDGVLERLARMDRASRRGPWTERVLGLIAAHPRRRAPDLAHEVGRETKRFKADVRKLKNLGLTISHAVGYELSPRGKAVLRRLNRARTREASR